MNEKRLSRESWIEEASEILQEDPHLWERKDADYYAEELAKSYFDDDYYEPAHAVGEDSSYWD